MSDSPRMWNIGDEIPFEVFVVDPITQGQGLTGQASYISLTVKRESDGTFWDGSAWVPAAPTPPALSVAEVDATNEPGCYRYTLPAAANDQADLYSGHAAINNPGLPLVADNYELHVSRDLTVRVYEAEPSQ